MAKAKGMTRKDAIRDVIPIHAEFTKSGQRITRKSLLEQFFPHTKNVDTPFGGLLSPKPMLKYGIRKHGAGHHVSYDLTPAAMETHLGIAPIASPATKPIPATTPPRNAAKPPTAKTAVLLSSKEGKRLLKLHKTRERNAALVPAKKRLAQSKFGCLRCSVCKFDFARRYGPHGDGFIECHHTKPLSDRLEEEESMLEDLELVCANCHRMPHRGKVMLSIAELRAMLRPTN